MSETDDRLNNATKSGDVQLVRQLLEIYEPVSLQLRAYGSEPRKSASDALLAARAR